jgi:hypothetical protein
MLEKVDPAIVLIDLAQRIDAEHHAVATALQSALAHAIAAGEFLIEARAKVKLNKHGRWLLWLKANCSVPQRTASHYMRLARRREKLCDENGNCCRLSVNEALDMLKHPAECGFPGSEWGEYVPRVRVEWWGQKAWDHRFTGALRQVTHIAQCNPPAAKYIVKAVREGKTPGLTAPALREAIVLLTRYADALEK